MKKKPAHKKPGLEKKPPIIHTIIFYVVLVTGILFFGSYWFKTPVVKAQPCANSVSCIKDLSGTYEKDAQTGEFMGKKVAVKDAIGAPRNHVLGDNTLEKKIYVDLTAQRLYTKEGDTIMYSYPISSGKWNPTPSGMFKIWIKLRYTRMKGGNKAIGTYYDLPNVPYTMYFYNDEVSKSQGYSIHGAYWHTNFGHPMSHGCINMRIEDAQMVYDWVNPPTEGNVTNTTDDNLGTEVIIYGTTPSE